MNGTMKPVFPLLIPVIAVAGLNLICGSGSVRAESPNDAVVRLEAAIEKEVATHHADATNPQDNWKIHNDQQLKYMLTQLKSFVSRGEFDQAEQILNMPITSLLTSDDELKEATNLASALREAREAKQTERTAKAEAALKRAGDLVRSAKDPKELDPIITELTIYRDQVDGPMPESARAVFNKVRSTLQFMQRWQDYLAALKAGNTKEAQSHLRSAMNIEGSDLLPRSEILALTSKLAAGAGEDKPVTAEQIDNIVANIKNPDDLDAAIRQLESFKKRSSSSEGELLGSTINALAPLNQFYKEFEAGLPAKFDGNVIRLSPSASSKITALQAKVLLIVLPRYLKVSSDLMPKSGETVAGYVERMIDEGKSRGDARLIIQARNVQRWLMTGSMPYPGNVESPGVSLFEAGQNQEAAGQYALAIVSYQNALKSGDDAVPARLIGERLAKLKAAHPQDYEQAMRDFPVFRDIPYFRRRESTCRRLPIHANERTRNR